MMHHLLASAAVTDCRCWPEPPPLTPGVVQVWSAAQDGYADWRAWLPLLTAEERRKAERFHFERDRRRFAVCRGLLRVLLSRYLDMPPTAIALTYGNHGKPALACQRVRFNVSHSHGWALLAFTLDREIGVDLEKLRPLRNAEGLARRFFAPREAAVLLGLPEAERLAAFFRCWTRKEAYIKAIGTGLACPLDQFAVTLAPGEPAQLLWVANRADEVARWSMTHLDPAPGFVAALIAEGHDWRWEQRIITART
ncbi:MAG: 4'-phosphopantetheinyl transferase family protein [Gemmataceae bacterium]